MAEGGDGISRAADRVFRAWKNGGGQTAEILAHPRGAGMEDFDWRLSTAVVAADGPFSVFHGVDRVLTVIEGGPMTLAIGGDTVTLGPDDPPYAFRGDADCHARLDGPALLDFNVMTRRPTGATVQRTRLAPQSTGLALLLEPAAGLARLDLVDLERISPALRADLSGARVVLVTFRAA